MHLPPTQRYLLHAGSARPPCTYTLGPPTATHALPPAAGTCQSFAPYLRRTPLGPSPPASRRRSTCCQARRHRRPPSPPCARCTACPFCWAASTSPRGPASLTTPATAPASPSSSSSPRPQHPAGQQSPPAGLLRYDSARPPPRLPACLPCRPAGRPAGRPAACSTACWPALLCLCASPPPLAMQAGFGRILQGVARELQSAASAPLPEVGAGSIAEVSLVLPPCGGREGGGWPGIVWLSL